MITFTSFDVVTAEHNLRVDKVNRFGWLRSGTPDTRRPHRLGSVLSALVALIGRPSAGRVSQEAPADAITAVSNVQGAA